MFGTVRGGHIDVKNRELIGKLITSVVIANNDSITKQELEGYLDDGVISGNLHVQFKDKQVIWKTLEDNIGDHKERFHNVVERLSNLDDNSIQVIFDVRCKTCGGDLKRLKPSDDGSKKFRCNTCMVTHTFTISSSAEVDTTGDDSVTVF